MLSRIKDLDHIYTFFAGECSHSIFFWDYLNDIKKSCAQKTDLRHLEQILERGHFTYLSIIDKPARLRYWDGNAVYSINQILYQYLSIYSLATDINPIYLEVMQKKIYEI